MKTEILYTKSKDFWIDKQMEITKCEKCGNDLDPMKSYPVSKPTKKSTPTPRGYIFVCSSCQIKTIQKSLSLKGMWL